MRRLALIVGLVSAIAVPAAAVAGIGAPDDGVVVQSGQAPYNPGGAPNVPVVQLTITGSVIGQVYRHRQARHRRRPERRRRREPPGDRRRAAARPRCGATTAQVWTGTGFKFRAVGGTYTVLVYGSGVNLVAVGTGTVRLAGQPDEPTATAGTR